MTNAPVKPLRPAWQRSFHPHVFSYSPIYYWGPTLLTAGLALSLPVLLVVRDSPWPEKMLVAIALSPIALAFWRQHERIRRQAWSICVTGDGLIGQSLIGETTRLTWQEIDCIDGPSLWDVSLDAMPRIILRSRNTDQEFIIGKNLRGYKELAQIIKANTPYCSHDAL